MRDVHEDRFRMAMRGYTESRRRFLKALLTNPRDVPGALVPVVEALWWAISLDEELKKEHGDVYRSERDADPGGRMMLGVRYARNRCGHQRAIAIENLTVRFRWKEGELPGRMAGATWKEHLPAGDGGHENSKQRDEYREHLAGRQVGRTFSALGRWFGRYDPDRQEAGRG